MYTKTILFTAFSRRTSPHNAAAISAHCRMNRPYASPPAQAGSEGNLQKIMFETLVYLKLLFGVTGIVFQPIGVYVTTIRPTRGTVRNVQEKSQFKFLKVLLFRYFRSFYLHDASTTRKDLNSGPVDLKSERQRTHAGKPARNCTHYCSSNPPGFRFRNRSDVLVCRHQPAP